MGYKGEERKKEKERNVGNIMQEREGGERRSGEKYDNNNNSLFWYIMDSLMSKNLFLDLFFSQLTFFPLGRALTVNQFLRGNP